MKTYSLEKITDKHLGKIGTPERDAFDQELRLDVIGQTIKKLREERKMNS
jgi:hypothetical protein